MPTAKEIIRKFNDLKTLPHVAIRVTQLVNSEKSTMRDFEEVIKLDPILVTRLLRLVNSPYFGLANKVESISKAIVYCGMKNLRNLVAVEAIKGLFNDDGSDPVFSRSHLWLHCATISILSDMIGKRIFGLAGDDLFLAGILHDIGLVVEDQVVGDLLREACRAYDPPNKYLVECEREVIGTDHCEVGMLMAKEWKMPEEVLKAIRFHHDMERKNPISSVTSILQLAEYIAGKMNYSAIPKKIDPLYPQLVRHVKNMMGNYKLIVRDLPAEMAKAKELYEH
ncbi:MAG: HDOD domain-containing protein [Desulfobulbaceae bacterium]|nr:HDOD domain-containing protein [Desulfobulbaceae bacterium]MCK5436902.1 HDOD domain-containing protein [Desulfobulbaceae bacterium]